MLNEFALGDHVMMRKPHACGTNAWVIIRVGADIKIKCVKCSRIVMMDRFDFIRSAKKLLPEPSDTNEKGQE